MIVRRSYSARPRPAALVTLEDAGNYITKLPKAEHEAPEWQAAMEALILVATSGAGPALSNPALLFMSANYQHRQASIYEDLRCLTPQQ